MFNFERDRDREKTHACQWGRGRDGDTESEAGSRLGAVSTEPDVGLELTNHELMTCAGIGNPMLN